KGRPGGLRTYWVSFALRLRTVSRAAMLPRGGARARRFCLAADRGAAAAAGNRGIARKRPATRSGVATSLYLNPLGCYASRTKDNFRENQPLRNLRLYYNLVTQSALLICRHCSLIAGSKRSYGMPMASLIALDESLVVY